MLKIYTLLAAISTHQFTVHFLNTEEKKTHIASVFILSERELGSDSDRKKGRWSSSSMIVRCSFSPSSILHTLLGAEGNLSHMEQNKHTHTPTPTHSHTIRHKRGGKYKREVKRFTPRRRYLHFNRQLEALNTG